MTEQSIEHAQLVSTPLPAMSERLMQRRIVAGEATELDHLRESFEAADQIVDDALEFSGINRNTAPIRWEAARKAAMYATYVALGLTRDVALRQVTHKLASRGNRDWLARDMQMDHIGRFESRISQSRIGEE